MIALQIADTKTFMQKLLLTDTFDRFLMLEAIITTFNTFHIDGILHSAYYTQEEQELLAERTLSLWAEVRPFCLTLIKGKKTPLSFRFTFGLSAPNTQKLLTQTGIALTLSEVRALLINLRYDGHLLTCTTGTSLTVFTPDKKLDHAWDDMVQKYFRQQGIPFEQL